MVGKHDCPEGMLHELEFRMGVTTVMLSTLDLDYILYVILSGITSGDGLGFNRAFILLDDDDARELRVRLALGPTSSEDAYRIWETIEREKVVFSDLLPRYEAFCNDSASQGLTRRLRPFRIPLQGLEVIAAGGGDVLSGDQSLSVILARSLMDRTPSVSNDVTLHQEVGGSAGEIFTFRRVAMVPLVVDGRLIGAIVADNVFSNCAVNSDQRRALHALGNLAALAIDRARLHARTLAMAEIDGLTGVYNRRYYAEAVDRTIAQAKRTGAKLSIVIFDIDFFKGYNDRNGHLVGDAILKEVAQILVDQVRSSDLVARYGGEEFVVLFKDTPVEVARVVAEKLRVFVKDHKLAAGRVEGLTLSAGVAEVRSGEDAEQLFARADAALYEAKRGGRDRVVVAVDGPIADAQEDAT